MRGVRSCRSSWRIDVDCVNSMLRSNLHKNKLGHAICCRCYYTTAAPAGQTFIFQVFGEIQTTAALAAKLHMVTVRQQFIGRPLPSLHVHSLFIPDFSSAPQPIPVYIVPLCPLIPSHPICRRRECRPNPPNCIAESLFQPPPRPRAQGQILHPGRHCRPDVAKSSRVFPRRENPIRHGPCRLRRPGVLY